MVADDDGLAQPEFVVGVGVLVVLAVVLLADELEHALRLAHGLAAGPEELLLQGLSKGARTLISSSTSADSVSMCIWP